jgi:hypothetical protein
MADDGKLSSFIFACLKQIDADPKTSAMEFRLAYMISQMINKKTRVCFPLQSTLAERLGVKERAVRGFVSGLRDRGHLRVRHRGPYKSSIYELILQDRHQRAAHDEARPADTCRSSEDDQSEDRQNDVARPANPRRKTGTSVPVEPVSEPISEPEERGAPKARPRSSLSGEEESPPTSITESMLARAFKRAGWDAARSGIEFDKFRHRCLSKATQSHDWDAEFSLWIERGVEHTSKRTQQQGPVIDQHGNPVPPPKSRSHTGRRKSNLERGREMFGGGQ